MFGYVTVDKPNILIKDYYAYRAVYCGLCKSIGAQSGQAMRFTLNYDIVVLALLGFNYEKFVPKFKEGHCVVHPFGRKLRYVENNPIMTKISDINTLLGYYKVQDDVVDENKHKLIKSALTPYSRRAKKRMPDLDKKITTGYEKLRALEATRGELELVSDEFGYMLMAVGEALTDKCDKLLREFLYYLGKWVYAIDALDDLKKDFEKGSFNPFLRDVKEWNDNVVKMAEDKARVFLYECIDRIESCYDKMDITICEGPLSNIIYKGLRQRTESVIKRRGEKWKEIRLRY